MRPLARQTRLRVVLLGLSMTVGVLLVLAGPARALTRRQADAIAMRSLAPQHQQSAGGIVLYGLPSALARGSTVSAEQGPGRAPSAAKLRARTWLFWEDEDPGAMFVHPSELLLVNDRTRKATRQGLGWWPLIDGEVAPFLRADGTIPARYVVYQRLGTSARASDTPWPALWSFPRTPAPAPPPLQIKPGDLADSCLVMVGYWRTNAGPGAPPIMGQDLAPLTRLAQSLHLKAINAGQSVKDLDKAVANAIKGGCTDVFLVIDGHGNAPPGQIKDGLETKSVSGGPPGILLKYDRIPGTHSIDREILTPEDIASLLKSHDKTKPLDQRATFKVKINSCFAGRFEEVLKAASNVRDYELSSAADEISWIRLPNAKAMRDGKEVVVPNDKNSLGVTEFMNANLHGLDAWARSGAAYYHPDLGQGVKFAFTLGYPYDFPASVSYTHPIEGGNDKADTVTFPDKPRLVGLKVEFFPARYSTIYTESTAGPGTHYFGWSVDIPMDAGCAHGFMPNKPQPDQATWYHADETQGGPCNHAHYSEPGTGHPGFVTVRISNTYWLCFGTYFGTKGDGTNYTAFGRQIPCHRKK